jgi:S1-C subfamily serine protease
MSILKTTSMVIGMLVLGALGALIFNVSLFPYFLASAYFKDFQFVKDYQQGKIVVNKTEQVYIQENTAIENAIEKVKGSIVMVQGRGTASGLISTSDGSIVTLANVLPANGNAKVFLAGALVDATLVKKDSKNNLALLTINHNNLPTVPFSSSDTIQLGQAVFIVVPTTPTEDNWMADKGIIKEIDTNVIKTTIPAGSGTQGAPLFNSASELVGISFMDQDSRISVIPIDKIQLLLGL